MSVHHDLSEMNVLFVHSSLDDYPLTCEEFRVYGHLARRAKDGKAYPGYNSIAESCRIHPDTAKAVVRRLESYGMIRIEQRGHLGLPNLYHLTSRSAWKTAEAVLALQEAVAGAGKAKRKAKRIPTLQTTPPETEGGDFDTPPFKQGGRETEPPQGDETEGGEGGETKGTEGNPGLSIQGHPEKNTLAAGAAARTPLTDGGEQTPPTAEGGAHTPAQVTSPAPQEPSPPTSPEKVPPGPPRRLTDAAQLIAAWNAHRGPLPAVETVTEGRKKSIKRLLADCGGDVPRAVEVLTEATRDVAADPFWLERRYGFDNLVPGKVFARAEAWRSRQGQPATSPGQPAAPALSTAALHVGQRVTYKREAYTVETLTDTYADLYDDENGSTRVLLASSDWAAVKPLEGRNP